MASKQFDDATRELDVRETDGQPFDEITTALDELSDGETLLLINGFEPEPLYEVLESRGFAYEASNPRPEEWHVRIARA